MDKKCSVIETIPESEYISVIQLLLEQQGYEVKNILFDVGIEEECIGSGLSVRYEKKHIVMD